MAGKCETITNSASAEARVEAWAELGKSSVPWLCHNKASDRYGVGVNG